MNTFLPKVQIKIEENLTLKNPESSNLGKKILKGSIQLIDQLGYEHFNFKKLATHIQSTEASIYRYFENKNKILLYLLNWYWSYMEYNLLFATTNVASPHDRLKSCIQLLTSEITENGNFEHINEKILHQIVVSESLKGYLNKEVDLENQVGAFIPYKQLVQRISNIILEINSSYKYPHMLVSTVIEGAHIQRHFANHLPRLTDVIDGEDAVTEFYTEIVFKAIK